MSVSKEKFGSVNGETIYLFKLSNDHGLEVSCLNLGCIITSIFTPNKKGELENIVLGYDTLEEYLNCSNYFGAVIGRVAGRIEGARFELGGKEVKLDKNENNNHIHGGKKGFNQVIWDTRVVQDNKDEVALEFSYLSNDGEAGYPGNTEIVITYSLDLKDNFTITYSARSDKDTVLNLTNHTYFNLNGDLTENVLNHTLKLKSKQFLELNSEFLPTGNHLDVSGTPFDFRKGKRLEEGITFPHEQNLLVGRGYDHPFLLEENHQQEIVLSSSGRKLIVETDEPCVILYTGNSLGEGFWVRDVPSQRYLGVCLETQKHPNAVNQPGFPSIKIKKNTTYHSKTIYQFRTC